MINKFANKELRLWTKAEDDILTLYFNTMPFSSWSGSRFDMLNKKLKEAGYNDRTAKAVSRRTFRLGLKSYVPNDVLIDCQCYDCKKAIQVKKRYFNMNTAHRCKECQQFRNREWDRVNRNKKNLYVKEWRKIKEEKGENK